MVEHPRSIDCRTTDNRPGRMLSPTPPSLYRGPHSVEVIPEPPRLPTTAASSFVAVRPVT
jgi:hypothetical protein